MKALFSWTEDSFRPFQFLDSDSDSLSRGLQFQGPNWVPVGCKFGHEASVCAQAPCLYPRTSDREAASDEETQIDPPRGMDMITCIYYNIPISYLSKYAE